MWKLWFCSSSFFLPFFLSFPSSITQKLCNVYEWSAHASKERWVMTQTRCVVCYLYAILCRNMHTILPIEPILYYRRDLFPGLELYVKYEWRVMDSNMHPNHFPIRCFVYTYTHNLKTTYHIQTFFRTTALQSKMTIFNVKAGSEIQLVSYSSKYSS